MAPSRWERKVTASSSTLRNADNEAAGIGQYRMRPIHEAVQPAERRDAFGAGTQHEMIRVCQHDLRAAGAHGIGREPLHGRLRADRHEGRRRHRAMRRDDLAVADAALRGEETEGKGLEPHRARCGLCPCVVGGVARNGGNVLFSRLFGSLSTPGSSRARTHAETQNTATSQ
jgi:hypothetical protein